MTENFAPHSPAVAPQARSLRRLRPAKAALYLGAMMACVGGLSASALHASVQGPPDGLIPAGPPTTSRPVVPVPTPAPAPTPTPAPTPAPSPAPNPAPSASGGDGPRVSVPVIQQLPTRSTAPARAPQVQTRPVATSSAAPVRDRARDSAPAPRADGNGATRANAGDTPFSTLPTDSADGTAALQSDGGAGVAASGSGDNAGDGFDTPVTTSVPVSSAASSTPEWLPLAALGALALLIGGLFWWRKSRNRPVTTVEEWAEPVALAAEPAPPPATPPAPVIAQEAAVAPKPKAKGRAKKDAASQAPVDAEAALAPVVPDATESVPVAAAVAAAAAGAATAATIAQPRAPLGQRADLVIDFEPLTAASTLVNLRLRYAITLRNMGHSTAAPVLVRIGLFAGTMANEQGLLHWFQLDDGQVHERIEQIVPGESYRFEGELAAALDALNPMLIDGRRIAVPIVAVDARYNHDASAAPIEGQVARAFVVGRDSGAAGGKLAPFRFDLGPTSFTPLGQRDTGISRNQ